MQTVGAHGRSSEKMTETNFQLFVRPNAADSDHISRFYVLFVFRRLPQFLLRSSENKNVSYIWNRKISNILS